MEAFKIYKEIQPTYGEWFSILTELGYQKHVVDIKRPISKQYTKQRYPCRKYLLHRLFARRLFNA